MKRYFALCVLMLAVSTVSFSGVVNFPGGRIAITSDGNIHDQDDFGATAMAIAMLHYAGLGDKLVHYDFSNHLGKNTASGDAQMIESAIEGAKRFKLDKTKFFNDQTQIEAAIANFKAEGNNSSADNPLWFICAGPMESAWRCVNAVEPEKRQYIYCISHSGWNDKHGDTPEMTHKWEDLGKLGAKLIHIADQNGSNGDNDFNTPEANWLWLKESSNPDWQWLFSRNVKKTFDVSDAGMTWWLITGGSKDDNEKAGWAETRALFDPTYKYEKPKPAVEAPKPNKPAAKKANAKNRIVINDPLKGSSLGKAAGGKFLENGGWTVKKAGDRIIWELPAMGPDGMLELDIRNLDPTLQAKTAQINFLGLWGHLFDNKERKGVHSGIPDTDGFEMRMSNLSPKYKLEYHSFGIGSVAWWTPFEKYDLNHTYHLKIEWRGGVVTTWLDDNKCVFDKGCSPDDPIDHFNFLHLGTSPQFGNQAAIGPIYSNLKITEINE